MIQQSDYCSFQGVMEGSIFGRQMEQAERESALPAYRGSPNWPSIHGGTSARETRPPSGSHRTWAARFTSSTTTRTPASA